MKFTACWARVRYEFADLVTYLELSTRYCLNYADDGREAIKTWYCNIDLY